MKLAHEVAVVGVVSAMIVSSVPATESATGQGRRVTWYVVNGAMGARGDSLNLGSRQHTVTLGNGWSCAVGPTSEKLLTYEARKTICEKGSEAFQFTVQCEEARAKDHTQIGFLNKDRRLGDFIEVGCELR
jgi:hypothetical protein